MLINLHIKNLALIEEIDVYFDKGLNILTGETGAGKSIIIGSINIAIGAKIPKDMIRDQSKDALVELVFQVESDRMIEQIKGLDIPIEEDGNIILSRKIIGNRSTNKVNGENVTVSTLKELAVLLIDIHGQHEHQSLLHRKKHLEILDEFSKEELLPVKKELQVQFKIYTDLKKEISESALDEEQRLREVDFLNFEIQEIAEAAPQPGEDKIIEEQYKKMVNSQKITSTIRKVCQLTGYDEPGSVGESVGRAIKEFNAVLQYDDSLNDMSGLLVDIDGLLSDFNREVSAYIDDMDFSQGHFLEIEDRLNILNKLKSKYGKNLENVLEYKQEKEKRLEQLLEYEMYMDNLNRQLKECERILEQQSIQISNIRQKYAIGLTKKIKEALVDLNFLEVKFEVELLKTDHYTVNGSDDVGFLISTNPGEKVKPLGQIASGGELSRIMLAIKTVLADKDATESLIFDEIDVGISGRTAQKVSEKLSQIACSHQVICITHLPQIAAMADVHYSIEKNADPKKVTMTTIRKLEEDEVIMELARILGGAQITDKVMESAKEMKMLAKGIKNIL